MSPTVLAVDLIWLPSSRLGALHSNLWLGLSRQRDIELRQAQGSCEKKKKNNKKKRELVCGSYGALQAELYASSPSPLCRNDMTPAYDG